MLTNLSTLKLSANLFFVYLYILHSYISLINVIIRRIFTLLDSPVFFSINYLSSQYNWYSFDYNK